MFAYRTTTGSATPLPNALLQTYVPSRSLRWTIVFIGLNYCTIPKEAQNHFHRFINCSHLVEWPPWLKPSSWILTHLQETARNTSLPSLFDPLTLALYSNSILSLKNTHTYLTLCQSHIYSLTASFSWKTNASFLFSILSTCFLLKKKKKKTLGFFFYLLIFFKKAPFYVYCVY